MKEKLYILVGDQEKAEDWLRTNHPEIDRELDHRNYVVITNLNDTRALRGRKYDPKSDEVVWLDGSEWWDDDDRMRIDQQIRMMRNP